MKITRVQSQIVKLPAEEPLAGGPGFYRPFFEFVALRMLTDEGIEGLGITFFGWALTATLKHAVDQLSEFVIGEDPLRLEAVGRKVRNAVAGAGPGGISTLAYSAIDIALWDIKGKYYKEPVWRLLGGAQNPVPAYVTFGLKQYTKEQLVEVARQFVAQGEHRLKMVVAVDPEDPNIDAERVRAVREEVGEKVELMIDANYLFSFNRALELCKLVEPYRITWFEEPVYQNDAHLLADLRRHTSIPIAAGQNEGHRFRHRELIVNRAVDIVQPNVCSVGGYTEAVKVAAMAQAFNLPIANGGGWPHHNMHLQAGMANGWRVEFHLDMWKVGEVIYQDPPAPDHGWVTLTEAPGLGLEPRWEALKEYEEK